jgi:hypothetical protein
MSKDENEPGWVAEGGGMFYAHITNTSAKAKILSRGECMSFIST